MVKTRIHKYLQVTLLWGVNKDMAEYLYGKKMYGAEKDIIISFLKKVS